MRDWFSPHAKLAETLLATFDANGNDGSHPYAGLVFDQAGNLYGTTTYGGVNGHGTVFELSPSGSGWVLQTLYSFQSPSDGGHPYAGLIFDSVGNLYGATTDGGSGNGGTVFELSPSGGGWNFQVLYSFAGPRGGLFPGPIANLTFDHSGNLYGTTHVDGLFNYGSVFKLTHGSGGWTYTSLHDFSGAGDGGYPRSQPVFDASGNLYGTASEGGSVACGQASCGVVFEITP